MFSRGLSRDNEFFSLFHDIADLIVQASQEFKKLCHDVDNVESYTQNIKDLEHQADNITHRTIELLHKTFITPLDRDDIYKLISRLDDIMDFIDATAQRIFYFDIKIITHETKQLADIVVAASQNIQKAVHGLQNLKFPREILTTCVEINRLENEADQILRMGVGKLFREEPDTRLLIKLKETYELLETVTDRCEDVANVIESIVLEYS